MNKFLAIVVIICVIALGVSARLSRATADRSGPSPAAGDPGLTRQHSGSSYRDLEPGPGGFVRGFPSVPEEKLPKSQIPGAGRLSPDKAPLPPFAGGTAKTPEQEEQDRKLMEESKKRRQKEAEESRKKTEEMNLRSKMEAPERYFTLPSGLDQKARAAYLRRLASNEPLPHAGGTVRLGTWPQKTGAPEPVEWDIVERFSGNIVMVISKYVLECRPFHDGEEIPAGWSGCSLRSWLNGEFFDTAFSEADKKRILTADVHDVPETAGSAAFLRDKVFLLCEDEANAIYPDIVQRKRCFATRHARDAGVLTEEKTGFGAWFVSGNRICLGGAVDQEGWLKPMDRQFYSLRFAGVRPAMWIKLK